MFQGDGGVNHRVEVMAPDPMSVTLHNIHYTNVYGPQTPSLPVDRMHNAFPVKVPFGTAEQTKEVPGSYVGQMGYLYTA